MKLTLNETCTATQRNITTTPLTGTDNTDIENILNEWGNAAKVTGWYEAEHGSRGEIDGFRLLQEGVEDYALDVARYWFDGEDTWRSVNYDHALVGIGVAEELGYTIFHITV